jgi:hypothetical protein
MVSLGGSAMYSTGRWRKAIAGQAKEGLAKFASCAPPKLAKTKSSENVLSGD